MPTSGRRPPTNLVDKIRTLLAIRELSLADVSRASRTGSPDSRLDHVPHNLYDAIRKRQFSPSIYQLASLSIRSRYRLIDWLKLFGFSLDDSPRLQALLPTLRTLELDARIYDPHARVPWFRDVATPSFSASLVPLSRWLVSTEPRRAESLPPAASNAFRFVKIGSHDAFAFPGLLPGSIVRVKTLPRTETNTPIDDKCSRDLFLIEHGRGFVCSQIHHTERNQIVLCPRQLPYASVELTRETQATVHGFADLEMRKTVNIEKPMVHRSFRDYWMPVDLPPLQVRNVGEFIRKARRRSGLSFREASKRTRLVAQTLRDNRYFCAPGSLSDYETRKSPPRHVHKIISICAVYFASAADFLESAGVKLNRPDQLSMPPGFLEDIEPGNRTKSAAHSFEFMKEMERRFQELPYFLYRAMPGFFGLPSLSIRDVFWAGGIERFVHPYMDGAVFLILDRRRRTPHTSASCPIWAQPLYVFLRRDGSYLCGSCNRLNGFLIVRPAMAGFPKLLRLRNRVDAEVVGQIVGIVRRLK
jgi:transcriptional regulator with XRE-family HTH domain